MDLVGKTKSEGTNPLHWSAARKIRVTKEEEYKKCEEKGHISTRKFPHPEYYNPLKGTILDSCNECGIHFTRSATAEEKKFYQEMSSILHSA